MLAEPVDISGAWTWLDYAVAHRDLSPTQAASLRAAATTQRPVDVSIDGGPPQRCRIELTAEGYRIIVLRRGEH